jgi:uncharacterized protein YbbC (DUF1343 family)
MQKYLNCYIFCLIQLLLFLFSSINPAFTQVLPGAYQMDDYLPDLKNKKVGIVANQSSLIGNRHLIDTLLDLDVKIIKVFAPEHGFRGQNEAGALVNNTLDPETGIKIESLYGSNKRPNKNQLKDVEVMLFDLQGVGARFYTYISTLKYVMDACGEHNIPLFVLDRPNPHIHYIDGPVLKMGFQSFVGSLPIPIVYGMTDGELAQMINGEKWIDFSCDLKVIKIKNYTRSSVYELPVKPSPNLPNFNSIYLYPSLCLFEGTSLSIGRGTEFPFQVIGYPDYFPGNFTFVPRSIPGVSENPKFKDQKCFGYNLQNQYTSIYDKPNHLNIDWVGSFYESYAGNKNDYFNNFFDKLAGTDKLRRQIESGLSTAKIRESWQKELEDFDRKRRLYLIYPDE